MSGEGKRQKSYHRIFLLCLMLNISATASFIFQCALHRPDFILTNPQLKALPAKKNNLWHHCPMSSKHLHFSVLLFCLYLTRPGRIHTLNRRGLQLFQRRSLENIMFVFLKNDYIRNHLRWGCWSSLLVTMTQSSPGEEGTGCGACGLQGHCAAWPLGFHRSPSAAVIGLGLLQKSQDSPLLPCGAELSCKSGVPKLRLRSCWPQNQSSVHSTRFRETAHPYLRNTGSLCTLSNWSR